MYTGNKLRHDKYSLKKGAKIKIDIRIIEWSDNSVITPIWGQFLLYLDYAKMGFFYICINTTKTLYELETTVTCQILNRKL